MTSRPKNAQWKRDRNPQREWKAMRAKVNDEGRCRRCRTSYTLEASHIIPRSRVNAKRGGEDPRNCIPLCQRCHEAFHAGGFALENFLTPEEYAYAVELVGEGEADRRVKHKLCDFNCLCEKHDLTRRAA